MMRPVCGPLAALMAIAVATTAMAQPTKNAPPPTPAPNATPNSDQSNLDVARPVVPEHEGLGDAPELDRPLHRQTSSAKPGLKRRKIA